MRKIAAIALTQSLNVHCALTMFHILQDKSEHTIPMAQNPFFFFSSSVIFPRLHIAILLVVLCTLQHCVNGIVQRIYLFVCSYHCCCCLQHVALICFRIFFISACMPMAQHTQKNKNDPIRADLWRIIMFWSFTHQTLNPYTHAHSIHDNSE